MKLTLILQRNPSHRRRGFTFWTLGNQDQGVAFYVLKAIVTLAYPYPPPQMLTLCGTLLDLVIAIMKLFPQEARIQESAGSDPYPIRHETHQHLPTGLLRRLW